MKWFFPSWNGDFRLESGAAGYRENVVVLEITKPTAGERAMLAAFLADCVKKGYLDAAPEVIEVGATETQQIAFSGQDASLASLGALLKKRVKPTKQAVTAISSVDGEVKVIEASTPDLTKYIERAERDAKKKTGVLSRLKKGAAAAVSLARPTLCCPDCIPGSVPLASEVLLSFLTDEEHSMWATRRELVVTGGYSGHRYLIAHRHSPRAVRNKRICVDLDDGFVLKFYDWSVPPEEEVLAAKLLLEHCEDWLRNEASCFAAPHATSVFKNPFGDERDGLATARLLGALGGSLYGVAGEVNRIAAPFFGSDASLLSASG